MKLSYNATGAQRKKLVDAISQIQSAPTKYLGAPTFAYEVGGYHIDKNGTVTGKDNLDLEDELHQRGFDAGEREYDEPDTYERGLDGMGAVDDPADFASDTITIEMPMEGFTPEKLHNLRKLVDSKAEIIKTALGDKLADGGLPIEVATEERKLQFLWFAFMEGDEFMSWAWFISAICNAAKEAKRVTAKEKPGENMKFSFRVFLIRLGLVGDDYKIARKILLRNLPGNSAFAGGKQPVYTANCYTYPNGSEEDAMDCDSNDFTSLSKAKAHCDEFLADCESVKFAGAHVEDEDGKYLYTILTDGTVETK